MTDKATITDLKHHSATMRHQADVIEGLQNKIDALIHEQDELVKAIAARKTGKRDIESLYEWTALNFPTAWQLSGGNAQDDEPFIVDDAGNTGWTIP